MKELRWQPPVVQPSYAIDKQLEQLLRKRFPFLATKGAIGIVESNLSYSLNSYDLAYLRGLADAHVGNAEQLVAAIEAFGGIVVFYDDVETDTQPPLTRGSEGDLHDV